MTAVTHLQLHEGLLDKSILHLVQGKTKQYAGIGTGAQETTRGMTRRGQLNKNHDKDETLTRHSHNKMKKALAEGEETSPDKDLRNALDQPIVLGGLPLRRLHLENMGEGKRECGNAGMGRELGMHAYAFLTAYMHCCLTVCFPRTCMFALRSQHRQLCSALEHA
jgi:hypothetical protein